jgi:hypothetical protein
MLICSIPKPNFLLSKIIDLKDLAYASLVFNQLTKPNIYAFDVMLRGLTTTWKRYDFCVELDYKLKSLGLKANNFTYPFVCSVRECLGFGSWKDWSLSGVQGWYGW